MYERTHWADHVPNPANCFTITDNKNGTFTIVPAGTVQQQGTPQDQLHFNNIESGVTDAHIAIDLLLDFARQNSWEMEGGTVALTNAKPFPFNNSQKTISLVGAKENGAYVLLTEVTNAVGNVGELVISDKLTNGFKIEFTGSASFVTVKYIVLGGFLK